MRLVTYYLVSLYSPLAEKMVGVSGRETRMRLNIWCMDDSYSSRTSNIRCHLCLDYRLLFQYRQNNAVECIGLCPAEHSFTHAPRTNCGWRSFFLCSYPFELFRLWNKLLVAVASWYCIFGGCVSTGSGLLLYTWWAMQYTYYVQANLLEAVYVLRHRLLYNGYPASSQQGLQRTI